MHYSIDRMLGTCIVNANDGAGREMFTQASEFVNPANDVAVEPCEVNQCAGLRRPSSRVAFQHLDWQVAAAFTGNCGKLGVVFKRNEVPAAVREQRSTDRFGGVAMASPRF